MEKVTKLLSENRVMTIATSMGDKPRASILEYVMVGGSLMFATEENSIKALNLKQNKRISVSVMAMPKYVTIDGTVAEPAATEVAEYNKALFERHPEFKELIDKGVMHPFTYFKLVPETAYYNDMSAGMAPTEVIKA